MNALVSIVIPVYNQGAYLADAIESVLRQDYPNIECIVVNDGSTDHSLEVATSFGDRIRVLSQANAGQATALNLGMQHAAGDFIGYLSSDDQIDTSLIAECMQFAASAGRGPIVVFPRYRTIDSEGATIESECSRFLGIQHMVENFVCTVGPGAIFSRRIIKDVGGWNPKYRQIPDYEFWLRASGVAEFHQLPRVLASWRVHLGSQTAVGSSFEKAEESVQMAASFFKGSSWADEQTVLRAFRASALIYSAALHLSAGRLLVGSRRVVESLRIYPRQVITRGAIERILRSAALGVSVR